jgi:hypothetical protein
MREKVIQRLRFCLGVPKILHFLVKVTALWCPQGFCNGSSCFHCPPVLTCLALIQEYYCPAVLLLSTQILSMSL